MQAGLSKGLTVTREAELGLGLSYKLLDATHRGVGLCFLEVGRGRDCPGGGQGEDVKSEGLWAA